MKYPLPSIFTEKKIIPVAEYISIPEYKNLELSQSRVERLHHVRNISSDQIENISRSISFTITNTSNDSKQVL